MDLVEEIESIVIESPTPKVNEEEVVNFPQQTTFNADDMSEVHNY